MAAVFSTDAPPDGAGNDDSLSGGDDADTFIVSDGCGSDTIVGGEGSTDDDTIGLSALTGAVTVSYTGDEAGTITDGTDTITFSQVEKLILTDHADVVDATADTAGVDIDAGDGDNTVTGGTGDDRIVAGTGYDVLSGGDGADTLRGWAGLGWDDTLSDGDGADEIYGGNGLDIVDYSGSDAGVTVNLTTGAHTGGDAQGETLAGIDGITGSAFDDGQTGFDGSGPGWSNVIDGGVGNDTLDGMGSDDTLIGGAGNDSIIGGTGIDVFEYSVRDSLDTIADFNTGNTGALGDGDTTNNDFIDLGNFRYDINELRADFDDDGVLYQSNDGSGEANYSDNDQMEVSDGVAFQGASGDSFTSGTLASFASPPARRSARRLRTC